MKKRILSTLLALCMALGMLPGTAGAENAEDGIMPLTTVDDHTPPTVTGVYMNSPGGTVTVGDKLEFSVSAEDESGISFTSSLNFIFVCEQNHAHTERARLNSYDEDAKQAKFELRSL